MVNKSKNRELNFSITKLAWNEISRWRPSFIFDETEITQKNMSNKFNANPTTSKIDKDNAMAVILIFRRSFSTFLHIDFNITLQKRLNFRYEDKITHYVLEIWQMITYLKSQSFILQIVYRKYLKYDEENTYSTLIKPT